MHGCASPRRRDGFAFLGRSGDLSESRRAHFLSARRLGSYAFMSETTGAWDIKTNISFFKALKRYLRPINKTMFTFRLALRRRERGGTLLSFYYIIISDGLGAQEIPSTSCLCLFGKQKSSLDEAELMGDKAAKDPSNHSKFPYSCLSPSSLLSPL